MVMQEILQEEAVEQEEQVDQWLQMLEVQEDQDHQ
jgi:hypothetical protein